MKNVSIRIPEAAPLGDTFFDASVFAIVSALFVNSPGGGKVDTVLTFAIHLFLPFSTLLLLEREVALMLSLGFRLISARQAAATRAQLCKVCGVYKYRTLHAWQWSATFTGYIRPRYAPHDWVPNRGAAVNAGSYAFSSKAGEPHTGEAAPTSGGRQLQGRLD